MVGYITESSGEGYTPTPEGQHVMVCARIVDLGTQPGSPMFPTPKRKLMVGWELPEIMHEYTDADGKPRSAPLLHVERFTVSFHEKATLRQRLESWRGTPFTKKDFAGPPDGFHLRKLIGIPALVQIVHKHEDGKTFANMNAIMKPPKVLFDQFKNKLDGQPIFFDLDSFEQAEFDRLSDRVKETIQRSPEYQRLFAQAPEGQAQAGAPIMDRGPFEDDIPF